LPRRSPRSKHVGVHYYRDRQKNEIDFVLEVNQELYPIEVKLGATVRRDWVHPFRCLKGHAHGAVICQVDQHQAINSEGSAVPWNTF